MKTLLGSDKLSILKSLPTQQLQRKLDDHIRKVTYFQLMLDKEEREILLCLQAKRTTAQQTSI